MLKKYRKTTGLLCLLIAFVWMSLVSCPHAVNAADGTEQVVRVGYYPRKDFQEGTSDGTPKSGYAYEYLQQIASYTGWRYEYVYGEWDELYHKLEDGEIDLMAGVSYSKEREKKISYPEYDMLKETFYIYKDSNDNSIRSGDLASYAGKKLGTVNEQRMASYIKKWVSENDVDVEICYYNNITECAEDFNNGKLDGYVSADNIVSSYTGITPVELIGKEPYYLAVAKDRDDLLKDLNATLSVIQEQNAFYLDELQNKYSTESSVNIFLSRQEQEWMENHSKITVGYLNNYLPYSATDAKGEVTGLIADAVPDIIRTLPGKYRPGVTYQGFDDQQEMMERLNLTQLIQDVMDIMSVQAVSAGLSLTHETEEEQLGTWPDIMGNPVQLREIFLNIVGNAVKYNKPGGKIEWKDRLTASTDRNVLYECSIADTGIGMEKEYLKHIFEPFSQEHTDARTVYQGTGLGMPIVKTLVERMGGTIEIDSVPGEGSTVYISLPFHVSETVQEIPATEEMEDVPLKGKRILLVEDNDLNLEIAQFLLEDAGAEVITARNGKQAVDTYMAKPSGTYDAILMDIMMPVMNGNEAAQKIRWSGWADARKIPIIAVTACASEENRTASADAGINGYLTKPLDVEKLVSTLVALIRNTTAREECARL